MIKVVFDTNILLSASMWHGNPYKLVQKVQNKELELYISSDILIELERALSLPKFGLAEKEIANFLDYFVDISNLVYPIEDINAVKTDPSDNAIIECAIEAKADYIVSGDRDLLNLKEFRGIKIIKARELIKLLGE